MLAGTVARLFRYPVKSMHGEELRAAAVGLQGLNGDRRWAFVQAENRSTFPWLTARNAAALLRYTPRFVAPFDAPGREPPLTVETPDGRVLAVDADELRSELEQVFGRPLSLLHTFLGVPDVAPISLFNLALADAIGTAAGRALDPRRFRANLYLQPAVGADLTDADLVGRTLAIGPELCIAITQQDQRCMMVGLDPDTAENDATIHKTVVQAFDNRAGVYGVVLRAGRVQMGDEVVVEG